MKPTLICPTMRYWRMAPDPRLSPLVLCYYLARPVAGQRLDATASPAVVEPGHEEELLMPDGHSEIVFNLGGSYERWHVARPQRRTIMSRSYVIGGRSRTVVTRDIAPVTVAGVKLDPRALKRLIGIPLDEFRDSTLSLQDIGAADLLELEDAIANAGLTAQAAVAQVAAVLDRYLLAALRDMPPLDRPVDHLIARIRAQRGDVSIIEHIRALGLDVRNFERRFREFVGMPPKSYARIVRFKHSYHLLVSSGRTRPGLHLGPYCDQSHFNKEFRAFVGAAPSARLKATLEQGTSISDHLLAAELESRDWS